MKNRLVRLAVVSIAALIFAEGCMLSRLVDRAFLGMSVRRPAYADRKGTGVFLLPITAVIDLATFPIQALLVVFIGDNFPFTDPPDALSMIYALNDHPQFKKLGAPEQAIARAELEELFDSNTLTANSALALGDDGHWTVVELSADAREQLIARAGPLSGGALVCTR